MSGELGTNVSEQVVDFVLYYFKTEGGEVTALKGDQLSTQTFKVACTHTHTSIAFSVLFV